MKLGIVGSRQRNSQEDHAILIDRVKMLQPDMIISGGCPKGADHFAEGIAKHFGIPITIYYPKLSNGQSHTRQEVVDAMYARNLLIATHSDRLIALVAPDRKGGTESTINYFREQIKIRYGDKKEKDLEIL